MGLPPQTAASAVWEVLDKDTVPAHLHLTLVLTPVQLVIGCSYLLPKMD